jgi:hypothetical protein
MRHTTGLLSPYVGSKENVTKYPVHDGGDYDAIIEPFLGSGHFTTRHIGSIGKAFVAEQDPSVWAVAYCWTQPRLRVAVDSIVLQYRAMILEDAETAYDYLKSEFDRIVAEGKAFWNRPVTVKLAAVSITIRKLLFGAVTRPNATTGKLNVSLSQDKLKTFEKKHGVPQLQLLTREECQTWVHHWRPLPQGAQVHLFLDWRFTCMALERSSVESAIAFIDPMYWVPYRPGTARRGTGAMTPAYRGHDPSDRQLLMDCIDCVEWLLSTGKVKRLVVTNYISDPMRAAMARLAQKYDFPLWFSDLGPLNTMNKRHKAKTQYHEGAWEFGEVKTFRDRVPVDDSAEQLSLVP